MEITIRIPTKKPNPKKDPQETYSKKNKKKKKKAKEKQDSTKDPTNLDDEMDMAEGINPDDADTTNVESQATGDSYTEEKLFHCVMPCGKGTATIFTFPKEYMVTASVMIMGLIPYTTHLYGEEAKKWFGWSALQRERGSRWCEKTQSVISPNDERMKESLNSGPWWLHDALAMGAEEQADPLGMPTRPEHNLGRNEKIANERQINTGSIVTFANQIDIRTFNKDSDAGESTVATNTKAADSDSDSDEDSDDVSTEQSDEDPDDYDEPAAPTNRSGNSSSSSNQTSGDGTSEECEDESDNSDAEMLMKLLKKPSIRRRLLQEVKKGQKKERKGKSKKEVTPTKSSFQKSAATRITPPKLAGKTGQQRARDASTSGGRGAGIAR
jgi:hypothetical protein